MPDDWKPLSLEINIPQEEPLLPSRQQQLPSSGQNKEERKKGLEKTVGVVTPRFPERGLRSLLQRKLESTQIPRMALVNVTNLPTS